jgi:hypothetical protein
MDWKLHIFSEMTPIKEFVYPHVNDEARADRHVLVIGTLEIRVPLQSMGNDMNIYMCPIVHVLTSFIYHHCRPTSRIQCIPNFEDKADCIWLHGATGGGPPMVEVWD